MGYRTAVANYRGARVPKITWFFTVAVAIRDRNTLLVKRIEYVATCVG